MDNSDRRVNNWSLPFTRTLANREAALTLLLNLHSPLSPYNSPSLPFPSLSLSYTSPLLSLQVSRRQPHIDPKENTHLVVKFDLCMSKYLLLGDLYSTSLISGWLEALRNDYDFQGSYCLSFLTVNDR